MADGSLDAARSLVLHHGWNSECYQALNPGMQRWFSRQGDAVAGYSSYQGVRVIAGGPICPSDQLEATINELEWDTHAQGERLLYFGVGTRLAQLYATRHDYCRVLLGAQPVWDPAMWSATVNKKSSLRAQLHRARNKEVRIVEWPIARARNAPPLRAVLHDWLATRGLPPLHFMATTNLLSRIEDRRIFVAERGSNHEVIGFLMATPIPAREGWLIEQWPRTRTAPNGTTHLLVDAAMRAFATSGSRYATLGLAPLSRHCGDAGPTQPAWLRLVLHWARAHGRRFYNFEGLEAFKASLQPMTWEPIFAVAQGKRFTPGMLRAVAGVFAGGPPEEFVVRGITSAIVQEWRALRGAYSRRIPPSDATAQIQT